MAARKVIVAGGTGFIGRALCKSLTKRGYEVIVLSRTPGHSKITWSELKKKGELPECDAVINLAGENIGNPLKRWTADFQAELRESRIGANERLTNLIKNAAKPPKVWISSSAIGRVISSHATICSPLTVPQPGQDEIGLVVKYFAYILFKGYYPASETVEYTEDTPPEPENNFATELCCDWENSAKLPSDHSCRHVIVRIGLVLGRDGGAIQSMIWPFWLGLGGVLGSGKQVMSWIHIADTEGIFVHALENDNVTGVLNATAPQPVTNAVFTKELASALQRPAFLPVPEFAIKMIFGNERGSLMLEGQKVIPKRTMESGYSFLFPDIKSCLLDIVK